MKNKRKRKIKVVPESNKYVSIAVMLRDNVPCTCNNPNCRPRLPDREEIKMMGGNYPQKVTHLRHILVLLGRFTDCCIHTLNTVGSEAAGTAWITIDFKSETDWGYFSLSKETEDIPFIMLHAPGEMDYDVWRRMKNCETMRKHKVLNKKATEDFACSIIAQTTLLSDDTPTVVKRMRKAGGIDEPHTFLTKGDVRWLKATDEILEKTGGYSRLTKVQ